MEIDLFDIMDRQWKGWKKEFEKINQLQEVH